MKKSKLIFMLKTVIGILVTLSVIYVFLLFTRVAGEYTIEVGTAADANLFRRYSWDNGTFTWVEEPDVSCVGTTTGKIEVFPMTYDVTVHVIFIDRELPVVTTQEVRGQIGCSVTPEQFINKLEDDSECTVQFLTTPDTSAYGVQEVKLLITDTAGNVTEADARLSIFNVKELLVVDVGEQIPVAEEFLLVPGSAVEFITNVNEINTMEEKIHSITLLVDGMEASARLQIKDMTSPTLVLTEAEYWLNKPMDALDFVNMELTNDNSEAFEVSFVTEPDWTLLGEQEVHILATDGAGNKTDEVTKLRIKKDEKAPVVSVTDIDIKVGGTVSYKKAVSYYDDIDTKEEMKLSIERSNVNLKELGTYEVTYTVTDCSGNATSVTGKINVLEESPKWEDEDAIHSKAQGILDKILKEDMTDREKARAIYRWIKNNIGYVGHSEKGNYIRGAYEGLFKWQGDCFVYAATAKELLTLAGIQNSDVVKATTNPSHYWNLVYIEDGWYHFDSTPRKDKSEFFLLTDEQLEAYSSTHNNTHIFDRSLYPEIK